MRPANTKRTNRARSLRQADNDCEAQMWSLVRGRRLNDHKFVRQHPIGKYFVDFACRKKRLVVELDGSQHHNNEYDRLRDTFMAENGWSVLRFSNADVFTDAESVLNTIVAALDGRLKRPANSAELRFVPERTSPCNITDSIANGDSPSSDPSGHLLPASGEKKRPQIRTRND